MEALKRNFDAPVGMVLPNLLSQDENKRNHNRRKKKVLYDNVRIIVWQTHEESTVNFSC